MKTNKILVFPRPKGGEIQKALLVFKQFHYSMKWVQGVSLCAKKPANFPQPPAAVAVYFPALRAGKYTKTPVLPTTSAKERKSRAMHKAQRG